MSWIDQLPCLSFLSLPPFHYLVCRLTLNMSVSKKLECSPSLYEVVETASTFSQSDSVASHLTYGCQSCRVVLWILVFKVRTFWFREVNGLPQVTCLPGLPPKIESHPLGPCCLASLAFCPACLLFMVLKLGMSISRERKICHDNNGIYIMFFVY